MGDGRDGEYHHSRKRVSHFTGVGVRPFVGVDPDDRRGTPFHIRLRRGDFGVHGSVYRRVTHRRRMLLESGEAGSEARPLRSFMKGRTWHY